jgi:signal transduction histidine kinase
MADSLARQEKLRRKLVADVAHELRTPVAVLQVGHEALLDGVAQPTPASWGHCAMRCCGWRASSMTCASCRRLRQRHCS